MGGNMKRIFLLVMDSCGIGEAIDANEYNDTGANTFLHVYQSNNIYLPNFEKLGMYKLVGIDSNIDPIGYSARLCEESKGKDTLTGHSEMMGVITSIPFKTFTQTGFPKELIDKLQKETGRKVICNRAASGTAIIKELGEEQMETGDLIVYTSGDSVLQIAAHEDIIPVPVLYKYCEIARELTTKPEYKLGRVIARPFIGTPGNFVRTANRKDFALDPAGPTVLDELKSHGYDVIGLGKISDIFNGCGITENIHTEDNLDGLHKVEDIIKNRDFTGLCFANLNDFDSKYGHRRDYIGYGNALKQMDSFLPTIISAMHDDDLLMITADHGNDPTQKGTDHTRENTPLLIYSKSFKEHGYLGKYDTFSVIGSTIAQNFNVGLIHGESLLDKLK